MARPKSAATRLTAAMQAEEEAAQRLAKLKSERDAALIADRDADADHLAGQIETQKQVCVTLAHKVELLRGMANRETAARRVREREKLILRIENQFSERDEIAAELSATLVRPARWPSSRSAWRTQLRSVSAVQPILLAIDMIVAHCEPC